MELISQGQLTVERELKQELFLRAEELEKLVAIYKLKLCGDGTSSLNCRPNLLEKRCAEVPEEQRGQFYDIYMKKREEKLREEWRSKGADKEAEMRAMMDSLASTSSAMMSKRKVTGANNDHFRQTNSRMFSSRSSVISSTSQSSSTSTSQSSSTTTLNSTIRSSNLASNPLKGTNNGAIVQMSIARSTSSNGRTSLIKDTGVSRSQSLRKNSTSVGVQKDFTLQNSKPCTSIPPLNTNHRRRISITSFEDDEDIQKQLFSNEFSSSAYHRFENSSKIAEIPNSRSSHVQNIFQSETSDFSSSVDSPPFDPATGDSHNMNQYFDGKTVRVRKKWGSVERPFPTVAASPRSNIDVPKGIERFSKFGERSEVLEIHNDKDDCRDSRNYSSEDPRNSRMEQILSFGSFKERGILHEQGNSSHNQSHSARFKEREKHLLENYPKATCPLSSSSFHGRENKTGN